MSAIRRTMATVLLAIVLLAGSTMVPAAAQDPGTSATAGQVPTQDIVPTPNSGDEPDDAGDRGGALQLAVLALLVLGIAGAVVVVVRQSRRTRSS
jgi:hypothetical protein